MSNNVKQNDSELSTEKKPWTPPALETCKLESTLGSPGSGPDGPSPST